MRGNADLDLESTSNWCKASTRSGCMHASFATTCQFALYKIKFFKGYQNKKRNSFWVLMLLEIEKMVHSFHPQRSPPPPPTNCLTDRHLDKSERRRTSWLLTTFRYHHLSYFCCNSVNTCHSHVPVWSVKQPVN